MLVTRAGAELVGLVLSAFVAIWLSRTAGPEGLGYFAVTQVLIRFGAAIGAAGFPTVGSQRVAHREDSPTKAWSTVTTVRIVLAVILVVLAEIATVVSPVGDPTIRLLIRLTAPALLLIAVSSEWLLVAVGQVHGVSLSRVAGSMASAVAAIAFVRGPEDQAALAIVIVAPIAVAAGLTIAMAFGRSLAWRRLRIPARSALASYWRDAWSYLKADLSVLTYASIDRIFLYILATPAIVGLYEAAYKLIMPFYAISVVVSDSFFLRLAQSFGAPAEERRTLRQFSDIMFVATVPVGFFFLLYSMPVVLAFYGSAFEESGRYLALLGWVITFGYLAGALSMPFMPWRRPHEYANAHLAGFATNMVANIVLIPPLLAIGAALASIFAKIGVAIVGYVGFRRATKYPMLTDFLLYFAMSAAALGAGFASREVWHAPDLLSGSLFAATYLLLVYALRWRRSLRAHLQVGGALQSDGPGDRSP